MKQGSLVKCSLQWSVFRENIKRLKFLKKSVRKPSQLNKKHASFRSQSLLQHCFQNAIIIVLYAVFPLAKFRAIIPEISSSFLALANINDSACVAPPMVAKASKGSISRLDIVDVFRFKLRQCTRIFTRIGSQPCQQILDYTRVEVVGRNKHSSLLRCLINYPVIFTIQER